MTQMISEASEEYLKSVMVTYKFATKSDQLEWEARMSGTGRGLSSFGGNNVISESD